MSVDNPLTQAQAHYVLSQLLATKKVTAKDVNGCLNAMQKEIRDLESRLAKLKAARGATAAAPVAVPASPAPKAAAAAPKAKAKSKARLTPKQRISRQIQGVYMSLVRQFPAGKQANFKKVAKDKGREAAIDLMKAEMAKK